MANLRFSFRHFCRVILLTSVLCTAVRTTESSSSNVKVSMSNSPSVNLNVDNEGNLALRRLEDVFVTNAIIHDNAHATCFFWQDMATRPGDPHASFASFPFTQSFPYAGQYVAERIYCYDNTVDEEDENIFTIFMEYADGRQRLVRLRMSTDFDIFAEAPAGPGTEIEVPARAALMGVPASSDLTGQGLVYSRSICYFVPMDERSTDYRLSFFFTVGSSLELPARENYEKVVCLRDSF